MLVLVVAVQVVRPLTQRPLPRLLRLLRLVLVLVLVVAVVVVLLQTPLMTLRLELMRREERLLVRLPKKLLVRRLPMLRLQLQPMLLVVPPKKKPLVGLPQMQLQPMPLVVLLKKLLHNGYTIRLYVITQQEMHGLSMYKV